jgi:bifunctional DNA-binding transcriptional regulator/antitoxin component of YhaV-PrlF toxin-antitoxin module
MQVQIKTLQIDSRGRLVIPATWLELLGIRAPCEIKAWVDDLSGTVILAKPPVRLA